MAEGHVVTALRTFTSTGVGAFWVPATPPTVQGAWVKVPEKAGAVNVSCVGDVAVAKTVWAGAVFTFTRMLLLKKLPPVIVTAPPP